MGVRAAAFHADQADISQVVKLIDDVVGAFGGFDILVANAAVFIVDPGQGRGTLALAARQRCRRRQMAEVKTIVLAGPDLARDGVVRWRCCDLQGGDCSAVRGGVA